MCRPDALGHIQVKPLPLRCQQGRAQQVQRSLTTTEFKHTGTKQHDRKRSGDAPRRTAAAPPSPVPAVRRLERCAPACADAGCAQGRPPDSIRPASVRTMRHRTARAPALRPPQPPSARRFKRSVTIHCTAGCDCLDFGGSDLGRIAFFCPGAPHDKFSLKRTACDRDATASSASSAALRMRM